MKIFQKISWGKSKLTQKVLIGLGAVLLITSAIIPIARANQARDFDSNAILYGGAYSISELKTKIKEGNSDGPHQTAAELNHLYTTLGMDPKYFNDLSDGHIYKDGHVEVNGKTVATNVYTMGRTYMDGSTRESKITEYKVWWRHPSVSFASESIPAFVYVNTDKKMAFGIVKSCGNPIKGEGVIIPEDPTYTLTIKKFNDKNANKTKDANENMLANWKFNVTASGYENPFTTDKDGTIVIKNLKKKSYTITEVQQPGWTATTTGGVKQTVTLDKNMTIWFGNRMIPVKPAATYSIVAKKYEDIDGDKVHDENEPWLKDWHIKITGPENQEMITNENGSVTFSGLQAGTYTVSEVMQNGWTNTTAVSQTVALPDTKSLDGYVEFGNQKKKTPVTPEGTIVTPQPLPTSGPAEAVAGSLATVSLASAGIYFRKSKLALLSALKKF